MASWKAHQVGWTLAAIASVTVMPNEPAQSNTRGGKRWKPRGRDVLAVGVAKTRGPRLAEQLKAIWIRFHEARR